MSSFLPLVVIQETAISLSSVMNSNLDNICYNCQISPVQWMTLIFRLNCPKPSDRIVLWSRFSSVKSDSHMYALNHRKKKKKEILNTFPLKMFSTVSLRRAYLVSIVCFQWTSAVLSFCNHDTSGNVLMRFWECSACHVTFGTVLMCCISCKMIYFSLERTKCFEKT